MSPIDKFLNKSVFLIFSTIFALIFILNIFNSSSFSTIGLTEPAFFNFITLVIALIFIAIVYKHKDNVLSLIKKHHSPFLVLSILLCSVIFQLIILHLFNVKPSWDVEVILNEAKNIALFGEAKGDYLLRYQNNLFFVVLLASLFKIFTPELFIAQFINIALITVSQFLIYQITSKLTDKNIGLISLLISVVFFPYIFYSPIVYTDTFSLIFLLLPLNLLIGKDGTFNKNIFTLILVSILLAFGVLLKGSMAIFTIALSIVILLFFQRWKKLLLFVPIVFVIIIKLLFDTFTYASDFIDKEASEQFRFPVTHWIMMGQNPLNYGKYSRDDVRYTYDLLHKYSQDEVSEIHLDEVKNRFRDRGLYGSVIYNLHKVNHTWTDGTYYALNKLQRHPDHPNNFSRLTSGTIGTAVQGFARIQHLFILIGILCFVIKFRKSNNEFFTFGMLSVIGFFLFFIMWETRSRYIVTLTPILIILCCIGYFRKNKEISTTTDQRS